jgi:hypothetical protein
VSREPRPIKRPRAPPRAAVLVVIATRRCPRPCRRHADGKRGARSRHGASGPRRRRRGGRLHTDAFEHPLRVPSKEQPSNTDLQRAPLLDAQVEIAIAAGEIDRARSAADELGRVARLLADHGWEFHVLDLAAAEPGQAAGMSRSALGDGRDPRRARAKNAYRRRLAEIDDDIEQARGVGDAERAAHADTEHDFLVRELALAVGLGGRDRRALSASERARAGVTRAIRQALAHIGEHHPQLEHLNRAIRTGTCCAYFSDPRAPTGWRF